MRGGARPGAGRKKGTPNKITAEIKALAQVHAATAIRELARLALKAESEAARVAAIKELLDRGYGKPAQEIQHSGEIGVTRDPTQLSDDELAAIAAGSGAGATEEKAGKDKLSRLH